MHKFLALIIILFTNLSIAQDSRMDANEIKAFKAQVEKNSQATTSIKSDFVQYKHLDFLDNDIKTSGKLAFKSPGLVKWEYTNPYQYSVVFKNDKLLINDGGTKSNVDIGSSKMFKRLNELIVNSVKGNMFNDDDFEITYLKTSTANKAIFIPKDRKLKEYIASFELLFNKKDASVEEVKMIEPSEDFKRIVFSNRVLNSPIEDAIFSN